MSLIRSQRNHRDSLKWNKVKRVIGPVLKFGNANFYGRIGNVEHVPADSSLTFGEAAKREG